MDWKLNTTNIYLIPRTKTYSDDETETDNSMSTFIIYHEYWKNKFVIPFMLYDLYGCIINNAF